MVAHSATKQIPLIFIIVRHPNLRDVRGAKRAGLNGIIGLTSGGLDGWNVRRINEAEVRRKLIQLIKQLEQIHATQEEGGKVWIQV